MTALDWRIEIAPGADLTGDPDAWPWEDITSRWRRRSGFLIAVGRPDQFNHVPTGTCSLVLDNADGDFVTRNPLGQWYPLLRRNTPLRVRLLRDEVYYDRFTGTVPAWPTRWDKSGRSVTAPITARGVLHLLTQGTPPSRSPMRRSVTARDNLPTLLAYWPCEDGADADHAASAISGQPPMTASAAVVFAGNSFTGAGENSTGGTFRKGSLPLPDLSAGGRLVGQVPQGASSPVAWTVQFIGGTSDAASVVLCEWTTPGGTYVRWQVVNTQPSGDTDVIAYDSAGSPTTVLSRSGFAVGAAEHRADAVQDGADVDIRLWVFGEVEDTATLAGNTLGRVTSVTANPAQNAADDLSVGHIQVWDAHDVPSSQGDGVDGGTIDDDYGYPVFTALLSHFDETAVDRLTRLCGENGLSLSVEAAVSAGFVTRMAAQPVAVDLDLYRECEAAEGGILYEQGAGLAYLPREHRYNRPVALELDWALGNVDDPPEPVDDTFALRNRWTLRRDGASSATAEDLAHQAAEGGVVYEDSAAVNLSGDTALQQHAQWRVHLGTFPALRWPGLSWNLRHPNSEPLVDPWLACRVGSRITAANPPDAVTGDPVDLLIDGYQEFGSDYEWRVSANCSPAGPWTVGVLDDTDLGRADTTGCVLAAEVTAGATAWDVATASTGPLWTEDDTEFPLDWEVAGEQVTVTDITHTAITFVAVGAVNHGNNSSVTPGLPAGRAAGDLLVYLAAIRNSGTGVPDTPAGCQRAPVYEATSNVQVFIRIATNTAADQPTISFTGGVANATTSAQMIALRGDFSDLDNLVVAAAACLNASAQDITHPGLTVPWDNCVLIYTGWKAAVWDSVASPGTEIAEPDTTNGDDQGIVWAYGIQTTRAHIAGGSFVVTGGVAAISRGAVLAIRSDVQTATVARAVNGISKAHDAGTDIALRQPLIAAL